LVERSEMSGIAAGAGNAVDVAETHIRAARAGRALARGGDYRVASGLQGERVYADA
jgi:hypothetical protein